MIPSTASGVVSSSSTVEGILFLPERIYHVACLVAWIIVVVLYAVTLRG
jgi:hypothetical protein